MPLYSMTGFARKQTDFSYGDRKYSWTWEFKSVNAKGRDIKVKLPQWLDDLEEQVKTVCGKVFTRGTFNISLEIDVENKASEVRINENLLEKISNVMQKIYNQYPDFYEKPTPADLLKIPEVIKIVDNVPDDAEMAVLKNELCQSMYATATALKEDRQKEGNKIGNVLGKLIDNMETVMQKIVPICEKLPVCLKERIVKQINEFADGSNITPERLEQEVLFLIMRADVKEEIDRLHAHLKTARELLKSEEPVGRRLDFLCQELNREANTLCSKSMDLDLTKSGMELKAIIEQFREQIQNME